MWRRSYTRITLAIVGLAYCGAAAALLIAPQWFFDHIGSYPPYNQHYEGDLGSFQAGVGLAALVAAVNPRRNILAIWIVVLTSLLHLANHVYFAATSAGIQEWLTGVGPNFALVVIVAGALVVALLPGRDRKGFELRRWQVADGRLEAARARRAAGSRGTTTAARMTATVPRLRMTSVL